MDKKKKRVVGIVGPTASGKTALSLMVGKALSGEILCMDSMQIYRGMDIGTAKPTPEERAMLPHHLLDLIDPRESFSVSQYAERARDVVENVSVPMLVGGTGLYLQALSLPMDFGAVPGDEAIRARYHALADVQGAAALHALLRERDPLSAQRLHPNDVRRVIRALEVLELTGTPLSAQQMPGPEHSPYDFQLYALDWPRDILFSRIDRRVEEMLSQGLLREVEALMDAGVQPTDQSMQGLGYKELIPVLEKKETLEAATRLIKIRTRHYAKRQLTWFHRDGRIVWFPGASGKELEPICDQICCAYEN